MKKCFKCGEEKSLDDFYEHPAMGDGHLGKCKECARRDAKADYRAKRIAKAAYYEAREKTLQRKEWRKQQQLRRRAKDPQKYAAHTAVGNAIRDGRLKRQPCEMCGAIKVEAHHDDYSKPLDVRWLCFRHHREAHGQVTMEAYLEAQKA